MPTFNTTLFFTIYFDSDIVKSLNLMFQQHIKLLLNFNLWPLQISFATYLSIGKINNLCHQLLFLYLRFIGIIVKVSTSILLIKNNDKIHFLSLRFKVVVYLVPKVSKDTLQSLKFLKMILSSPSNEFDCQLTKEK